MVGVVKAQKIREKTINLSIIKKYLSKTLNKKYKKRKEKKK
jgi:hypothetical protein